MTASPRQRELPELPPLIHQAVLDPLLEEEALQNICDAARLLGFGGLCASLCHLEAVRNRIGPSGRLRLFAVVDFPFGTIPAELKRAQAEWAAARGADALDVVPNLAAITAGRAEAYAEELAKICDLGLPVTVILDVNRLQPERLSLAVEAAIDYQALAGSLFVQASMQTPGIAIGGGSADNLAITSLEMLSVLSNTQVLFRHLIGLILSLWLLQRV